MDVFCLEHDLDAVNLTDSGFAKAWRLIVSDFAKASRNLQFLDLLGAFFVKHSSYKNF